MTHMTYKMKCCHPVTGYVEELVSPAHTHTYSLFGVTMGDASNLCCLWLSCVFFSLHVSVFSSAVIYTENTAISKSLSSVYPILSKCVKQTDSEALALQSDGDVVIGGFFPLHYVAAEPQNSYHSKPQITTCSG